MIIKGVIDVVQDDPALVNSLFQRLGQISGRTRQFSQTTAEREEECFREVIRPYTIRERANAGLQALPDVRRILNCYMNADRDLRDAFDSGELKNVNLESSKRVQKVTTPQHDIERLVKLRRIRT